LEFSIKVAQPGRAKTGCAVVGIFDARKLSKAAASIDAAAKGSLSALLRRGDMQGKSGSTLLVHNIAGIAAERILLVGLGPEEEFGPRQYREAIAAAMRALNLTGAKQAEIHLSELAVGDRDVRWRVQQAVPIRADEKPSRKDR
jgi:leucyl aminopeptidase